MRDKGTDNREQVTERVRSSNSQALTPDLSLIAHRSSHAARRSMLAYAALVVGSIIVLIPFVWLISTSLKDPSKIFLDPPQWIPNPVRPENYVKALTVMPFPLYLWNTCKVTFMCLVLQVLSSSIVAFGFARMRFPGRNALFIVLLSTMMLPVHVTMIPVFKIWAGLGLYDTFVPLILPAAFGSAFFIFLLRQYYTTIPIEMDEAARIDGASTLQIWWRVLMPQAMPALITVAILSFMTHWNDFLGPLIYLSDPDKRTLALALWAFQGQYVTDWHLLMAASTVVMLPLLILFFTAQKYFIQGVVISGVKG
ncbi:MAG: carbohydrate ABC transporter permease [Armatimonadetes bacterium]|nr:carbohydrate ABC transporter permease [Armatimonadota bacterium]